MHASSSVSKADIPSIVGAEPLKVSKLFSVILFVLMLVGALVFILEVSGGDSKLSLIHI